MRFKKSIKNTTIKVIIDYINSGVIKGEHGGSERIFLNVSFFFVAHLCDSGSIELVISSNGGKLCSSGASSILNFCCYY